MRVLRFIWSGVLAFDRIGSRIPQLIQIWLLELFFVMPTTFFIGTVIDVNGCCGVPGTGEPIDAALWGSLVVGLVFGFFVIRSIFRPRLVDGEWAPATRLPAGPIDVMVLNNRWKVSYKYLTSHPSYVLLGLLTFPIPLVMVWMTQNRGDDVFYWKVSGWVGLGLLGLVAVLRLISWYVLRLGRKQIEQAANEMGFGVRRLGWEVAWKPIVMLMVLIYGIGAGTVGYLWWQELRTIDNLPLAVSTFEEKSESGTFVRVEGTIVGEPVYWAPRGTGRGGNNYSGAGAIVRLDQGGEVVMLAESLSVPDFKGDFDGLHDGDRVSTHGEVFDEPTDRQFEYYGWDATDLPEQEEARLLVRHSYP